MGDREGGTGPSGCLTAPGWESGRDWARGTRPARLPGRSAQDGDGAGVSLGSGLPDAPTEALADGSTDGAADGTGVALGAADALADGATLGATLGDADGWGAIVGP